MFQPDTKSIQHKHKLFPQCRLIATVTERFIMVLGLGFNTSYNTISRSKIRNSHGKNWVQSWPRPEVRMRWGLCTSSNWRCNFWALSHKVKCGCYIQRIWTNV